MQEYRDYRRDPAHKEAAMLISRFADIAGIPVTHIWSAPDELGRDRFYTRLRLNSSSEHILVIPERTRAALEKGPISSNEYLSALYDLAQAFAEHQPGAKPTGDYESPKASPAIVINMLNTIEDDIADVARNAHEMDIRAFRKKQGKPEIAEAAAPKHIFSRSKLHPDEIYRQRFESALTEAGMDR